MGEHGHFMLILPNLPAALEAERWIRKLPGVREATLRLVHQITVDETPFQERLERKLAETERHRPKLPHNKRS